VVLWFGARGKAFGTRESDGRGGAGDARGRAFLVDSLADVEPATE